MIDARNSPALRKALGPKAELLAAFLRKIVNQTASKLEQREAVVDQASHLISEVFVHLPTMRALYAVNPAGRLRLLKRQLPDLSEHAFQSEMVDIFRELRDRRANYIAPPPYRSATAVLPFRLAVFWEDGSRRFLVTETWNGYEQDGFQKGVEVTRWNGMPMERAVLDRAEEEPASNDASRFVFGLDSMTSRPLTRYPLPEEAWVAVTFRPAGSQQDEREILLPWNVVASRQPAESKPMELKGIRQEPPIGYLRIERFTEAGDFVGEFTRLLDRARRTFPRALIIDLRGTSDGPMEAAEQAIQLLTPHAVEPMLEQFLNTSATRQMVKARPEWNCRWNKTRLEQTGATFSAGAALVPAAELNSHGQRYHGGVLVLVDARTSGAAEVFAAGFQDHEAGIVLGMDRTTAGAVGDVEWQGTLADEKIDGFGSLGGSAQMAVPGRRVIRVGHHAGDLLDDDGVTPDDVHQLTRNDLLQGDSDLMDKTRELLGKVPAYTLETTVEETAEELKVNCTTEGIERLEFYISGHFLTAAPTDPAKTSSAIPIKLHGFIRLDEDVTLTLETRGYVTTDTAAGEEPGLRLAASSKTARGTAEWVKSSFLHAAGAGDTPSAPSP